MNDEEKNQETTGTTLKDIYELLLLRRNSAFSHNLQCSLFLTAFWVVCFIGYGAIVLKLCGGVPYDNTLIVYNTFNVAGAIIAILGLTFSILWLFLWRSSDVSPLKYDKSLSENKEKESNAKKEESAETKEATAGNPQEENQNNSSPIVNDKKEPNEEVFIARRINIAIGKILMATWGIVLVSHIILYILTFWNVIALTPTSSFWIFAIIVVILAFLIMFVVYNLNKDLNCKKKTTDSNYSIWNFKLINDNPLLNVIVWIVFVLIIYVLGFISHLDKFSENLEQYSMTTKDTIVFQIPPIKVDTITIEPSLSPQE